MATTEGCLVASTNRGCKVGVICITIIDTIILIIHTNDAYYSDTSQAISVSGGCYSVVMKDAITRYVYVSYI
jgi:hydroxymethylglutaryl-CoA reductase